MISAQQVKPFHINIIYHLILTCYRREEILIKAINIVISKYLVYLIKTNKVLFRNIFNSNDYF